ncbi:MAG: SPOR domain-containing protein [Gammaproteobacteria bacterium]|nr:MAG: SPOR domain-containing protein [Gammaproteobacteria bacterium]
MPRDYKEPVTSRKRPVPGWIWLLAGLMIGLFASGLIWLKDRGGDGREVLQAAQKELGQARREIASRKTPEPERSGYDFYTLLPELEVVVPDDEYESEAASSADRPRPATPSESSTPAAGVRYILQAGSFRDGSEAERLRARLALLGVESRIQRVVVNGDTWHRVRIGPFADLQQLRAVRKRLSNHHIKTLVTREAG